MAEQPVASRYEFDRLRIELSRNDEEKNKLTEEFLKKTNPDEDVSKLMPKIHDGEEKKEEPKEEVQQSPSEGASEEMPVPAPVEPKRSLWSRLLSTSPEAKKKQQEQAAEKAKEERQQREKEQNEKQLEERRQREEENRRQIQADQEERERERSSLAQKESEDRERVLKQNDSERIQSVSGNGGGGGGVSMGSAPSAAPISAAIETSPEENKISEREAITKREEEDSVNDSLARMEEQRIEKTERQAQVKSDKEAYRKEREAGEMELQATERKEWARIDAERAQQDKDNASIDEFRRLGEERDRITRDDQSRRDDELRSQGNVQGDYASFNLSFGQSGGGTVAPLNAYDDPRDNPANQAPVYEDFREQDQRNALERDLHNSPQHSVQEHLPQDHDSGGEERDRRERDHRDFENRRREDSDRRERDATDFASNRRMEEERRDRDQRDFSSRQNDTRTSWTSTLFTPVETNFLSAPDSSVNDDWRSRQIESPSMSSGGGYPAPADEREKFEPVRQQDDAREQDNRDFESQRSGSSGWTSSLFGPREDLSSQSPVSDEPVSYLNPAAEERDRAEKERREFDSQRQMESEKKEKEASEFAERRRDDDERKDRDRKDFEAQRSQTTERSMQFRDGKSMWVSSLFRPLDEPAAEPVLQNNSMDLPSSSSMPDYRVEKDRADVDSQRQADMDVRRVEEDRSSRDQQERTPWVSSLFGGGRDESIPATNSAYNDFSNDSQRDSYTEKYSPPVIQSGDDGPPDSFHSNRDAEHQRRQQEALDFAANRRLEDERRERDQRDFMERRESSLPMGFEQPSFGGGGGGGHDHFRAAQEAEQSRREVERRDFEVQRQETERFKNSRQELPSHYRPPDPYDRD